MCRCLRFWLSHSVIARDSSPSLSFSRSRRASSVSTCLRAQRRSRSTISQCQYSIDGGSE
jgi:hypothetical protein